jgi:uncharacterized membrane protein
MRKAVFGFVVLALVGFVGCNKSEKGGGTGRADSFTLTGPEMATTVKQGETRTDKLTLSRGDSFKEDVTLTTGDLPKGVKVEFVPSTVKASDKAEAEMKITAGKDAALGDAVIPVSAKPAKGDATSLNVKIKIEKGAE